MPGCMILNTEKDPDLGLNKFTFKYRDKVYTVIPKDSEGYNKIDEYFKYVAGVCKKPGLNPFMYKIRGKSPKDLFNIRPAGSGDKDKEKVDFSKLKKELKQKAKGIGRKKTNNPFPIKDLMRHVKKPAQNPPAQNPKVEQMSLFASDKSRIKRVLLRYAGWKDNDAALFWDEISNQEIDKEDAKKILDAFDKGADTEFSISEVTKIDSYTCSKVLDIANKFELLK